MDEDCYFHYDEQIQPASEGGSISTSCENQDSEMIHWWIKKKDNEDICFIYNSSRNFQE